MAAYPEFSPLSKQSRSVLFETGSAVDVLPSLALGIYTSDAFISGALEMVPYVFGRLAGHVVDVEILTNDVYREYENACVEYSYIINMHQAKNVLSDILGSATGSFDHHGNVVSGSGDQFIELRYPKFKYAMAKNIWNAVANEVAVGGNETVYSASFTVHEEVQDYDLQDIISNDPLYSASVGNKQIAIKRVFYKTPSSCWRFYGYYGGLNVVGNLQSYGQWADDSSFQVIPVWQNKLQASMFEDHLYTRTSHYSYQIRNNKLRLFPTPDHNIDSDKFWIEFMIPTDPWAANTNGTVGDVDPNGVNNMNTLPFGNIPYDKINSIGKQWIRRYCLSLCKEVLGHGRGKITSGIPIPGDKITLNHAELFAQAKDEQEKLKEELNKVLDELVYVKLAEQEAQKMESALLVGSKIPLFVYRGQLNEY